MAHMGRREEREIYEEQGDTISRAEYV